MRGNIKKWWRTYLAFGIWGLVIGFDIMFQAWGWLVLHICVGTLAIIIGDLSARYSNRKALRKAIAAWGGNETDVDAEWQVAPEPPTDWHLRVRGERYDNIELVYLGPILVHGHLCAHWRAVKPITMPDDVQPQEVQIVGVVPGEMIIDMWMHIPESW